MKHKIFFIVITAAISSCALLESNDNQTLPVSNTENKGTKTTKEKVSKAIALRLGTNGVEKNETEAFLLFKEAAIEGNIEAQTNLAWMYHMGIGVEQDKQLAIYWYTKSAEQGGGLSKYNLAFIYLFDKNYTEALNWFEKASLQGFIPAWTELGTMHSLGWGVEKNQEIAIQYYKIAAENGNEIGQLNLGLIYYEGREVPKNNIQAYAWFKITGCALNDQITCLDQVQQLTKKMSLEELQKAEELAINITHTIEKNTKNLLCHIENC